jgi:inositol phosphorylceramide mannosyltransferase catalytic subunit
MMYYCIILLLIIIISIIFYCIYRYNSLIDSENHNIKIPRIIHQTISDKHNIKTELKNNIDSLKQINPNWEHYIYDDNDIEEFIKQNYSNHIYETYKRINPEYGPARADYFRYLVIYKLGGIYFDIKSGSKDKLDNIINDNDEFIIINHPEWNEYAQWVIISKPGHPLMKEIIDAVTDKINNYNIKDDGVGKWGVLQLTGPKIYTKTINDNKHKYSNLTYCDNYQNIHLNYNNINDIWMSHINLFKNHYTTLTSPIVFGKE